MFGLGSRQPHSPRFERVSRGQGSVSASSRLRSQSWDSLGPSRVPPHSGAKPHLLPQSYSMEPLSFLPSPAPTSRHLSYIPETEKPACLRHGKLFFSTYITESQSRRALRTIWSVPLNLQGDMCEATQRPPISERTVVSIGLAWPGL